MGGAPKFAESQTLPDVDYAGFARQPRPAGDHGHRPRTTSGPPGTGRWPPTGRRCSTSTCDPDVPPIPPHATFEQMKDAAQAMLKGDENRWGIIKEGIKTKAQELLPHRDG